MEYFARMNMDRIAVWGRVWIWVVVVVRTALIKGARTWPTAKRNRITVIAYVK